MSIKTRSLVFATFFGSCIAVGLLLAALTTEYWVESEAKRHNASNSFGTINFGLFNGRKSLNVGYGLRNHSIDVLNLIQSEPDVMNYWLWLGAALGTGAALFTSTVSAVSAVLKAASSTRKRGTMVVLLISNSMSALGHIIAFVSWLVQFYQYMIHNILAIEELNLHWYTKGMTSLGHSFYFIVVSFIFVIVNIIILITAIKHEKRDKRRIEPPCDEKTHGAIMLY